MRIVGYIEHPVFKITVFQMNERLSVKLETSQYEQTYKFRQGQGIDTLEQVEALLDGPFLEKAQQIFATMHQAKMSRLESLVTPVDDEFEEIV